MKRAKHQECERVAGDVSRSFKAGRRGRLAAATGGFTLVEAVFAMGVVGILIVALYALQASMASKVQIGREDLRATQILVKKLDQMRLFSWLQINDPNAVPKKFIETFDPEEDRYGNRGKPRNTLTYSGSVDIADGPTDVSYGADMKTVTVTLQWKSVTGRARTRSATTYVAKYGQQNYIY
jgi:Tfp pilus assembly protein PilV